MGPGRDWRRWMPVPTGEAFVLCSRLPAYPGLWDLNLQREVVPHWTGLLRGNARFLLEVLRAEGWEEERRRAAEALGIFESLLDDLEAGAAQPVRTVHDLTLVREHLLRESGLADPYRGLKAREASRLLPEAHAALARAWVAGEGESGTGPLVRVLGELLAGNLFDLGSHATREAFREGGLDLPGARLRFRRVARRALARMDPARLALLQGPSVPLDARAAGRMLLFADNAGADFLLGVLPAALYWARRWEVGLVVNSLPASNDISHAEARAHLGLLRDLPGSPLGAALDAGRLRLIQSGTGSPGIDLRHVARELNRQAQGSAWIVIEGQGRAAETNWATRFRCPVLRVAVIKDPLVAVAIGATPGGAMLRWDEIL
jgi:hypothetical protein